MTRQPTAIIEREREGDYYVALCPQLDIASQGETVAEARANLKEALEMFSRRFQPPRFNTGSLERCSSDDFTNVYTDGTS